MGNGFVRRLVVVWASLVGVALASVAAAAQDTPVPPPPVRSTVDENGVDLISGKLLMGRTDVAIGPNNHHGLSFSRQWVEYGWRIANLPTLSGSTSYPVVSFGGQSYAFTGSSAAGYQPAFEDGSTLSNDRTKFISSDGTEITFGAAYASYYTTMASNLGRPSQVKFADGVVWTYHYNDVSYVVDTPPPQPPQLPPECYGANPPTGCGALWYQYQQAYQQWQAQQGTHYASRLGSITSSTGYQIKLGYGSDTASYATMHAWLTLARATAINNAVEYCSPTASCTLANSWPTVTYSGGAYSVRPPQITDALSRTTNLTYSGGNLTGIQAPGSSAVTYTYSGANVATVQRVGQTWTYTRAGGSTTVTNPLSHTRTVTYSGGLVTSDTNELGQTTEYAYCGASEANCPEGLLKTVTAPEENSVTLAYDPRGNVKLTTYTRKTGSNTSPATITTSATYAASCTSANQKICNKPTSTTDARGQVTNYDWVAAHGGLNYVQLVEGQGANDRQGLC